jgi:hypothetical protein
MRINNHEYNPSIFPYCQKTLVYLLEKLDFIKLQPKNILVIGHPTLKDKMLTALKVRYPEAQYDFLSEHIRDYPVKTNHYGLIFCHWLQPMDLLPDDLVDNVLSTYELLFYLFHHFLSPKALLLFSYLGPETSLPGLNIAEPVALTQPPMPALGDILLKLDYQDPVLDRDRLPYEKGYLELAYGHAWKKPEFERNFSRPDQEGTVFMPISKIQHLETVD